MWVVIGVIVILIGFFLYNLTLSNSSKTTGAVIAPNELPAQAETNVITIEASRFEYSPNVIHVKKGEHVKLVIDNTDTTHGIVIPDLGVSGIDSVEFTVDEAGTYQFRCPTVCGTGHRGMVGTLVVE